MKKFLCFIIVIVSFFLFVSCNKENKEVSSTPTNNIEETNIEKTNNKSEENVSSKTVALNRVNHNLRSKSTETDYTQEINKVLIRIYNLVSPDDNQNFVMSPTSIYLALALLDYIGDDNVKKEIRDLLGLDINSEFYIKEIFAHMYGDKNSKLFFTNSIWFDNNIEGELNHNALNDLGLDYYCDAFKTTFRDDNKQANEDIRKFVKEMTNGLIDKDFEALENTLFALFNTLYLKDYWGDNINLNIEQREFTINDTNVMKDFLMCYYQNGIAYSDNIAKSFYQMAAHTMLRLIVPNDDITLKEAMNSDHVYLEYKDYLKKYQVDETTYNLTRCIFPKFTVSSSIDLLERFSELGYLKKTILGFNTNLVNELILNVTAMKHDAILKVDEIGIEGAAVTVEIAAGAAPSQIQYIRHDFVVDKEFGFMITDKQGLILFMGTITNPSF